MNEDLKKEARENVTVVFKSIVVDDVGIVISMKNGDWTMAVSGRERELLVNLDFIKEEADKAVLAERKRCAEIARSYANNTVLDDYVRACNSIATAIEKGEEV